MDASIFLKKLPSSAIKLMALDQSNKCFQSSTMKQNILL